MVLPSTSLNLYLRRLVFTAVASAPACGNAVLRMEIPDTGLGGSIDGLQTSAPLLGTGGNRGGVGQGSGGMSGAGGRGGTMSLGLGGAPDAAGTSPGDMALVLAVDAQIDTAIDVGIRDFGSDVRDAGAIAEVQKPVVVDGRRPEGCTLGVIESPGTSLGVWASRCAELEGESVAAFIRLSQELKAHNAPADLVRRARKAARDEVRHFRLMRTVAQNHGTLTPRPPLRRLPVRPLPAIAFENAAEGCVGETYAAAMCLWQSQHAHNLQIRNIMAGLADDELEHAGLAHDVDAWIRSRLGATTIAVLDEIHRFAATRLLAELLLPVDTNLMTEAGLPPRSVARQLALGIRDFGCAAA